MRIPRAIAIILVVHTFLGLACVRGHAQAALLLQDADGIAQVLSPTGHEAVYFARICADSPAQLRRCRPGETGAVIARYHGIGGYDWLAMPLIPYLYSVEDASAVPARVDRDAVQQLRVQYHDMHLTNLGPNVSEGGGVRRGWNQLVGAAYERRIYAFRYETTEAQDDAFIARMNAAANRSHFNILFGNCADFAAGVLNFYFPHLTRRRPVPDAGIVTPRQVAYDLVRYAGKHPELHLTVMQIPLIQGFHRSSRVGKSAAESLIVTGYVVPIAILSPYAAGAIIADCLAWGRLPLPLQDAESLTPATMSILGNELPAAAGKPHSSAALKASANEQISEALY